MKPNPWTQEKLQSLRTMWPQIEMSASEIGRQIGFTKHSICGMARRMGLGSKPMPEWRKLALAKTRETAALKRTERTPEFQRRALSKAWEKVGTPYSKAGHKKGGSVLINDSSPISFSKGVKSAEMACGNKCRHCRSFFAVPGASVCYNCAYTPNRKAVGVVR